MVKLNQKSTILNTKIPTLVGIGVLVIGLIAGTVVFSQGSGVFLPRATEETTPKDVKVTNTTERSFSVSFATESETTAFVKIVGYNLATEGTDEMKSMSMQAGDDRDQLSGTIANYPLHHITATGLEAETNYYFVIGTDKGALYDNNGEKFVVKTAKRNTNAPNAKTIYGTVTNQNGGPAKGSIVYAQVEGSGEMSQLVQESGSWAIPLASTRTKDGLAYTNITDNSRLRIFIQGYPINLTSTFETTIGDFESGEAITLGKNQTSSDSNQPATTPTPKISVTTVPTPTISPKISPTATATPSAKTASPSATSGNSGGLADLLDSPVPSASPEASIIDLEKEGHQIVTSQQPTIVGSAPANTKITISIHSQTEIKKEVTTNASGDFELDLAALSKELEPGEHVIEYSYVDPKTGKTVTKTHTFTVSRPADTRLAQSYTTPSPAPTSKLTPSPTPVTYGTQSPYGNTTPTPTPTLTASQSANASSSANASISASKGGLASKSASTSGLPVSGSINSTLTLIFGGLFFMIAGGWSLWVAKEIERD